MVEENKCINCKVKECDPKDQPSTSFPLKEWCGDCIRTLKSISKGTKCNICHKGISEDAFIDLEEFTKPKLAKYDKEKDWLIHPFCWEVSDNDKYKDYQSEKCFEVIVIHDYKKEDPPLIKIKLLGCQCSNKNKEFKVCLKGIVYDENKDLIACPSCQSLDKYKNFQKEFNLDGKEVGNERHQMSLIIIYGGKQEPPRIPDTKKCADCQQDKKEEELITIKGENGVIKICQDCKKKRDDKPNEDYDNEKKWGADFKQLKPVQKEGRIATDSSWKKTCQDPQIRTSLLCPYCQEKFDYDKGIEDYLPATKEVEERLATHKNICSLKDDKDQQKILFQKSWDELREKIKKTGKGRRFFECNGDKGCWGKIIWDVNISDAELARKQCSADKKAHKEECHKSKEEKIIAVYHSPNRGGNKHADINVFTYEDIDDEPLRLDNQKQEQNPSQTSKGLSGGVIFALILGGVALIVGIIFLLTRNKNKKIK